MDTRTRGRNDYSSYDKSPTFKKKKIPNKLEESRSKSNTRTTTPMRNISPAYDRPNYNMMDTKKYIDMKKQTGGILNKKKSPNERSYTSNISSNTNNPNNPNNLNNITSPKVDYVNASRSKSPICNNFDKSSSVSMGNTNTNTSTSTTKFKNSYADKSYSYVNMKSPSNNISNSNSNNLQSSGHHFNNNNVNNKSKDKNINYADNMGIKSRDNSSNKSYCANPNAISNSSNYNTNSYCHPNSNTIKKSPGTPSNNKVFNNGNVYAKNNFPSEINNGNNVNNGNNGNIPNNLNNLNNMQRNKINLLQNQNAHNKGINEISYNSQTSQNSFAQNKNPKLNNKQPYPPEDFHEYIPKKQVIRSKTPVENDRVRPQPNLVSSHNSSKYDKYDYFPDSSTTEGREAMQVYTNYRRLRESNLSNNSDINSIPINDKSLRDKEDMYNSNLVFDKTFGRISNLSKMMSSGKNSSANVNLNTEGSCKFPVGNIANTNLNTNNGYSPYNPNTFNANSCSPNTCNPTLNSNIPYNPYNPYITSETRTNTTENSKIRNTNSTNKINSLEKNDSFSFMKTQNTNMTSHFPADSNLNKETSESLKSKMTNTHSTGGNSAFTQMEEVKALFQKMDPEEIHFVSINLIQSSKVVVRMHEHTQEKENLFSTVTKCDEKDL